MRGQVHGPGATGLTGTQGGPSKECESVLTGSELRKPHRSEGPSSLGLTRPGTSSPRHLRCQVLGRPTKGFHGGPVTDAFFA